MAENITPVKLKIDDFAEREVMSVDYVFDRKTDLEGQLAGITRGGKIAIRVKALNDGNAQLLGWMLNPTEPKNITLEFTNTVDDKKEKDIQGTDCYCVHYVEKWEEGVGDYEEITVVCREFKNAGAVFTNPWK